jgi:hypothetical protein
MKKLNKILLLGLAIGSTLYIQALEVRPIYDKAIAAAVENAPFIREQLSKVPVNRAIEIANPYIPAGARSNICKPVCFVGGALGTLPEDTKKGLGLLCGRECKDTGNPKAAAALGVK